MKISGKMARNVSLHIEKAPGCTAYRAKLCAEGGSVIAANDFEYALDASIFTRLEDCAGKNVKANAGMIRKFGGALFSNVFRGAMLSNYHKLRDSRLRLKLIMDNEKSDLLRIPWEFMFDGEDFLSANRGMTIARGLDRTAGGIINDVAGKLKTLAIIPSVVDLPEFYRPEIEREKAIVRRSTARPGISDKIELDFLKRATVEALRQRLASEEYHILHFVLHGVYSQRERMCYVLFEDELGGTSRVDSETIAQLLAGQRSLRLVIFSCYHSAMAIGHRVLADLPLFLLPRGVPAVIVMQYSVTDQSAIRLSERLLGGICRGMPLDHALANARRALLRTGHEGLVDFASPILYSVHSDGLFTH